MCDGRGQDSRPQQLDLVALIQTKEEEFMTELDTKQKEHRDWNREHVHWLEELTRWRAEREEAVELFRDIERGLGHWG